MAQQEIIEVITAYLKRANDKTAYALLLNGEWGAGKTYYFKNTLVPKIEVLPTKGGDATTYKVLYITLNGISKTTEIVDAVLNEKMANWFDIDSAAKNTTPAVQKAGGKGNFFEKIANWFNTGRANKKAITPNVLKAYVPIFNIGKLLLNGLIKKATTVDFAKDYPMDKLRKLSNFSGYVICFDDLERCTIPVKEVLGFINSHFVEHFGIKTIIIANEKEIKPQEDYNFIKEKLIGRTIEFKPSQKDILDTILINPKLSLLNAYRNFIDEKLDYIGDNKVWNLRTLFFAFENLETVLKCLDADYIKQLNDLNAEYNLFHQLIYYVLAVSYEYKHSIIDEHYKYLKMSARSLKTIELYRADNSSEKEIKYKNSYQHPLFPNEKINQLICNFVEKGIFQEAEFKTLLVEHLAQEKINFANKQANAKHEELKEKIRIFFKVVRFSTSIEQVQNAIKSIKDILEMTCLRACFDEGSVYWFIPIDFLGELQVFKNKGFISQDFLQEFCGDLNENIVNWYLKQPCFDKVGDLLTDNFINEQTNKIVIDMHNINTFNDNAKIPKKYLMELDDTLVQSNNYLRHAKKLFNKIETLAKALIEMESKITQEEIEDELTHNVANPSYEKIKSLSDNSTLLNAAVLSVSTTISLFWDYKCKGGKTKKTI